MKYYTDGFTKLKNPSPLGGGYTIVDENNTVITVENINKVGFTNNEAELLGVYNCLKICNKKDIISTDSMNTIAWVRAKKLKKVARQDLIISYTI
jgi:ribonuclease HI